MSDRKGINVVQKNAFAPKMIDFRNNSIDISDK